MTWTNPETQMAFVDMLAEWDEAREAIPEWADVYSADVVDVLAEKVCHKFEMETDGTLGWRLRKLMLSRVDWKQLAGRLLEWAGVEAKGVSQ
ncbi:MAG TPA: hypothetical protein VGX70_08135 [Gemmataceae bacterium]|jgi:hypothetical protein|nr:hypothetical protein [Gemmataceae bacterium]